MSGNYLIRRGLKKSLSIILILTMLIGGLGITGLAPMDAYAADSERDIAIIVADIIDATKLITGSPINPDWVLSNSANGGGISSQDKEKFLTELRAYTIKYRDESEGNIGTLAKYAMALTSLGIDARQIPDDEGNPIDLIRLIAESDVAVNMEVAYVAPYVLMLFGLNAYELNDYDDAKFSVEGLVQHIIDKQSKKTLLWPDFFGEPAGIDETGMILPSLSKYYELYSQVQEAVDGAISALSGKQGSDGDFDSGWGANSSTAETIISGLVSLGINPYTDERFIKNNISLIDHLITYKTADNTLGHNDGSTTNEWSSIYGFQALVAYENLVNGSGRTNIYDIDEEVHIYTNWPDAKLLTSIAVTKKPTKTVYELGEEVTVAGIEVTAYYNANNDNTKIIDAGDIEVEAVDTSAAGTKSVTITYQGQTATFNITVKDAGGNTPQEKKVKITVKSSGKGTIASDGAYVIEAGKTTVMDVLKAVLAEAGKSYVIQGSYVSEIDGLSEFAQGANSGWMYYIDGVDPVRSADSYKLNGGEVIQWIYTADFTKESGSEKWNNTPLPSGANGSVDKETINQALKEILSGKKESFILQLANGSVSFDKESLEGLADQIKEGPFQVSIEIVQENNLSTKQKEAVGSRPIYDIKITADKNNISEFSGKLTFSIPYILKAGEKPTGIVVYYLDDRGELKPMEGYYDSGAGKVVFTVDHLSYYVIGYDETLVKWPFKDVTEDDSVNWFYSPVKFVYERGIFAGTDEATFSPNLNLTRAMAVTVMARLSGVELESYRLQPFNDVNNDSWYGPSIAWAKDAGIISGYEDSDGRYSFRPSDNISRQDLALMLDNYNRLVAKKEYKQTDATKFTDGENIAEYAKASIASMQQAGIIKGIKNPDGSYRFNPGGNATRAETAAMIYNMLLLLLQ